MPHATLHMNTSQALTLRALLIGIFFCLTAPNTYANSDYNLGNSLYQHGKGKAENFPRALESFQLAAKKKHASAQFYVGRMHQLGHGTTRDLKQAVTWYLRSGENGQARAWNNLANIFIDKDYQGYSPTRAIKCYKHASDLGMAMASDNLAEVYHFGKYDTPRDYQQAEQLYTLTLQQYENYPGAWNNLGRLYEQGGHGIERDVNAAARAYRKAAAHNDRYGYYNLADLYFDGDLEGTPDEIIRLFTQAADLGHSSAMAQLGWIYKTGRYGTVDQERALHYYEAAAAKGHANAQNSLAILLTDLNLENENSPRVLKLLESAAEKNNIHAINNYAHRIIEDNAQGESIEQGIQLLKKAAERDYPLANKKLGELARQTEFQQYFTATEIEHWTALAAKEKQIARAAAKRIINSAAPAAEQGNYDEAIALMTEAHHQMRSSDVNRFVMGRAYWWEAQTVGGRADPEWGWRLFAWLKEIYDRDYPNESNRILINNNIANSLIECGRIAQMRQVCQDAETLIHTMHGLPTKPPEGLQQATDYTFPASAYTTHYSAEMLAPIVNHREFEAGDWILRAPMETSLICAREHLTRTNWRDVFFIAGQVEYWARQVLASGTFPKHTNRGWMHSNLSEALLIKAEAYELLSLTAEALKCYNSIIDEDMRSYGGRDIHDAITRRARLLTQVGDGLSVDLALLQETALKRKNNKFENRDAYQFTQIALAHAQHMQGHQDEAYSLLEQILDSTSNSTYTFLRIEALRVQIECALADGQLDGTESALLEIIDLARTKGLNSLEPTLYELYAQYLAQSDQLQAAARIQQDAIDLLQRFQMQPRLPSAQTFLSQLDKQLSSQQADLFDLQPVRITSAPLPGQGSIAVFSLSNLASSENHFELSLNGQAIEITTRSPDTSIDPEFTHEQQALKFDLKAAATDQGSASQTETSLSAHEQVLIEVHAAPELFENGDQSIDIQVTLDGQQQQAELCLQADAGAANIAVIDAIELIDNPYYLVSIFHSISSINDSPQTIDLRAVSSQPTRIEAYNSQNQLLFIDAEGNGDFNDPGDMIHCALSPDLSPRILTEANTTQIEFRYQPHTPTVERVDIQIQTRQDTTEASWKTQVIDWIQPQGN